jgi:hypothetical protein
MEERKDKQNNSGEETPIYLTTDSTLQTSDEARRDKAIDPRQDDTMDVSDTDLKESDADKYAGSDRAGTAERKDNSI